MKVILIGLWVVAVALGSAYGVALFMPTPGAAKTEKAPALEAMKTRAISVPMVADGSTQGFVTMQFSYTVSSELLKSIKVPVEIYMIDDAFRTVYTDPALDFKHLEKYDLTKLTEHLLQATNDKVGAPLIKEILIDNFAYIPKDLKE